jgi:hypothetical protein
MKSHSTLLILIIYSKWTWGATGHGLVLLLSPIRYKEM